VRGVAAAVGSRFWKPLGGFHRDSGLPDSSRCQDNRQQILGSGVRAAWRAGVQQLVPGGTSPATVLPTTLACCCLLLLQRFPPPNVTHFLENG
jgi:hypothetical protein